MEDTFKTYKKALKAKYKEEKNGENWHFLLDPTPRKIRDLTLFVFKEILNENDLKTFHNFIGFAFESTKIQKVKDEIDKFRPLVTFLKGKTELADSTSADMLAVILNFNPRPYRNFIKKNSSTTHITEKVKSEIKKKFPSTVYKEANEIIIPKNVLKLTNGKKIKTILLGVDTGILALGTSLFYNAKNIKEKNYVIWDENQYKSIDCDNINQEFIYSTYIPYDENILNSFRKIKVDSDTSFFDAKKQPLIWYGKNANQEIEYFSSLGLHPETSKTLKPITKYIIKKYVK